MAVLKMGAIVTGIKGKIGGQIFQGGRSGQIMKNKESKKGFNRRASGGGGTVQAVINKSRFASVVKGWGALETATRDSWANLIGVWTFTNKFGDVYNGTKYQIFTALNLNALYLNIPLVSAAPVATNAVDMEISISDVEASGLIDFEWGVIPATVQVISVRASAPSTETKDLGSLVMRKLSILPSNTVQPYNLFVHYVSAWNVTPSIGSYIWFEVWYCDPAYPKKQFLQTYKRVVTA